MLVVITKNLKDFKKLKGLISDQQKMIKIFDQIELAHHFFKENEHSAIIAMLDQTTLKIDEMEYFFSFYFSNTMPVVLVETLEFESISPLFIYGVKRVFPRNEVIEGQKTRVIIELLETFNEEQEEVKLKAALEKQLIIEYNKANSLINSLNFGVLIMTPGIGSIGFVLQDANQEIERLLEFPLRKYLGSSFDELHTSGNISSSIKEIFKADISAISEKTSVLIEFNSENKKYIRRIINPFRDKNNEITGYIWLLLDVTSEVEKGFVDTLTGLFNRRYLQKNVTGELLRSLKVKHDGPFTLSMLMIDIDNFKRINDNFGHGIGDTAIETIGSILNKDVLFPNYAIRFGGEEFLIILIQQTKAYTREISERILSEVRGLKIHPEINLTISLGSFYCEDLRKLGLEDEQTMEEYLKTAIDKADKALYLAKEQGKNRFVEFQD